MQNSERFMYFFSIFDFYSDKEESSANNIVQKSVANVLYCSIWRAVSAIMFRLRNMLYCVAKHKNASILCIRIDTCCV